MGDGRLVLASGPTSTRLSGGRRRMPAPVARQAQQCALTRGDTTQRRQSVGHRKSVGALILTMKGGAEGR
jgi:hypothetical protein